MAGINTAEKRIVVLTKESTFYVPKDGSSSPIQTRSVSKMDRLVLDETDSDYGSGESLEKKLTAPLLWSCHALYLFVICVVLLVLLCLLLVYGKQDSAHLHSMAVAGLAGTLGYTIARAQTMLS